MLLLRLLRFLRGYVRFRAADGFPERFLNLCAQDDIPVWDAQRAGGVLSGFTTIPGYKAMCHCAKAAGMRLRMDQKIGLPFFLHRYRRRAGMLVGLLLFLLCLACLSGMIWSIEVSGNGRVPAEIILQACEDQGLRIGLRRSRLDAADMEKRLLEIMPQLSWASINLSGSSVVVEVREALDGVSVENNTPQNVVASKAGQLEVLEVYAGHPEAKLGQAVLPGQLLASGAMANRDGSTRYLAARAYVVARTRLELDAYVLRAPARQLVTLEKTHYTLRFLWLQIPLGPQPKNADALQCYVDRRILTAGGKALPCWIERRSYLALTPGTMALSDKELRLTAAERLLTDGWRQFSQAAFLRQEITVDLTEGGCRMAMTGTLQENIGVSVPLDTTAPPPE
ncbi:MAG: sporulation protein YqfD [Oscillospiraceae bacterium]|jgi:similar to stage IV sporulation protein|nr:sporulation protein YqfD [Oscillospiraceae bacterium]